MDPLEPYYVIVSHSYRMALTMFDAYCYVLWVKPAMTVQKRLWWIGAVYVTVMSILGWMPWYIPNILAYGLGALAAFFVMCLLDRTDFGQKIFLAVTFFCMHWQVGNIVGDVSDWSYRIWTSGLLSLKGHTYLAFFYEATAESYTFWFATYVVNCICTLLLNALLLYGAIWLMRRAYGSGQERLNRKELLLLLIPSVMGVFAYGVKEFYRNAYEAETAKSIYDLKGQSLLMILYCLPVILRSWSWSMYFVSGSRSSRQTGSAGYSRHR